MIHGNFAHMRLVGCASVAGLALVLAGCGATTITEHGKYQPKTTTQVVTVARTTTLSHTTTVPLTTTITRTATATATVTRTATVTEYVPGPVETVTVAEPGPVTTRTTVKRVSPTSAVARRQLGIPAGALLASDRVVHSVSSFTVSDRNVSCTLAGGVPRCAVIRHVWSAPAQLAGCDTADGVAFAVHGHAAAGLSCGTPGLAEIRKPVIAAGTDLADGKGYCEVRSFAVACFVLKGHGFTVSRTGYSLY
jgi:hypothetical protein